MFLFGKSRWLYNLYILFLSIILLSIGGCSNSTPDEDSSNTTSGENLAEIELVLGDTEMSLESQKVLVSMLQMLFASYTGSTAPTLSPTLWNNQASTCQSENRSYDTIGEGENARQSIAFTGKDGDAYELFLYNYDIESSNATEELGLGNGSYTFTQRLPNLGKSQEWQMVIFKQNPQSVDNSDKFEMIGNSRLDNVDKESKSLRISADLYSSDKVVVILVRKAKGNNNGKNGSKDLSFEISVNCAETPKDEMILSSIVPEFPLVNADPSTPYDNGAITAVGSGLSSVSNAVLSDASGNKKVVPFSVLDDSRITIESEFETTGDYTLKLESASGDSVAYEFYVVSTPKVTDVVPEATPLTITEGESKYIRFSGEGIFERTSIVIYPPDDIPFTLSSTSDPREGYAYAYNADSQEITLTLNFQVEGEIRLGLWAFEAHNPHFRKEDCEDLSLSEESCNDVMNAYSSVIDERQQVDVRSPSSNPPSPNEPGENYVDGFDYPVTNVIINNGNTPPTAEQMKAVTEGNGGYDCWRGDEVGNITVKEGECEMYEQLFGVNGERSEKNTLYHAMEDVTNNPDRSSTFKNHFWRVESDVGNFFTDGIHGAEDWNWGRGYDDIGLPVFVTANGTIKKIDDLGPQTGWDVIIEHQQRDSTTMISRYLHIQPCGGVEEFDINVGDTVKRGDRLGCLASATSFPSHLHFEIRQVAYSNYKGGGCGDYYYFSTTGCQGFETAEQVVETYNLMQNTYKIVDPSDFIDAHRPSHYTTDGEYIGDWQY